MFKYLLEYIGCAFKTLAKIQIFKLFIKGRQKDHALND